MEVQSLSRYVLCIAIVPFTALDWCTKDTGLEVNTIAIVLRSKHIARKKENLNNVRKEKGEEKKEIFVDIYEK